MNNTAGFVNNSLGPKSTIGFWDYRNISDQDEQTGVLSIGKDLVQKAFREIVKPISGEDNVLPLVFEEPDARVKEFNNILKSQAIEQSLCVSMRGLAREIFEGLDKTKFIVENLRAPKVGGVCFYVNNMDREAYFEVRQSPIRSDVIQGVLFLTDYSDESKDQLIKTTHDGVNVDQIVKKAASFLQ